MTKSIFGFRTKCFLKIFGKRVFFWLFYMTFALNFGSYANVNKFWPSRVTSLQMTFCPPAMTQLYSIKCSSKRTLTIRESINLHLTSCLAGLDLTKQVKMLFLQHKQRSWNQKNKQKASHTVIFPLKLVFSAQTLKF